MPLEIVEVLEMPKSEKDNWDKFEIISKFLGAVVLVFIPIVIKLGADSIAQSMQRAKLIQSLTTELVAGKTKRDIALIALNTAIPNKEKCNKLWFWGCQNDLEPKTLAEDEVLGIAEALTKRAIRDAEKQDRSLNLEDLEVARDIIIYRTHEEYYNEKFKPDIDRLTLLRAISSQDLKPTKEEILKKAEISEVISILQLSSTATSDSSLKGIRIVYIQYNSNKDKAEELREALQEKNISAPEIDKIDGIEKNDIRYANSADKKIAEELKKFLETEKSIKVESLIDLSEKGYRVPSGQLEIWLKD